jgi:P-type E1-E2 ATPase
MQESALAMSPRIADFIAEAEGAGHSLVCIGWDGHVLGVFALDEQPRAEAVAAIRHLQQLGIHTYLLTGDHASRAKVVGDTLGIDFEAELLPGDKLDAISRLRSKWGVVAMVGDGINDSPALAAADVGIAMGCGADVSRQSAAVCLLGNRLNRVPETIELARQTVTVIRQNLFWAFFYNFGGIALAAFGWLNPIWAAVAMVASSVVVIGNSLRLRGPAQLVSGQAGGDVLENELAATRPAGPFGNINNARVTTDHESSFDRDANMATLHQEQAV